MLVMEFCLIFDSCHNEIKLNLQKEYTRISRGDIISAAKTEKMGGLRAYLKKKPNNLIFGWKPNGIRPPGLNVA